MAVKANSATAINSVRISIDFKKYPEELEGSRLGGRFENGKDRRLWQAPPVIGREKKIGVARGIRQGEGRYAVAI